MTTARLSFGAAFTDLGSVGTQDGPTGMDSRFLSGADPAQAGSLRLLDAVRYDGDGQVRRRHYMTVVFTGDDGTSQAFSRSGENGRFEIIPVTPTMRGYGKIGGTGGKSTGFYRP